MTAGLETGLKQVGRSVPRVEGYEKVTGQAHYTTDLKLPGMLYARLVVSPYAHALISDIDSTAALKVPGVVKVVTAKDLDLKIEAIPSRKRNPLAETEVIFYGQPVAVVLGESEAAAEDGAALVQVNYKPLPVVSEILEAFKPDAPPVHVTATVPAAKDNDEKLPPNVANRHHFKQGDLAEGFREAEVVVEHTYRLPMVHQSYLETQTCMAAPDPMGGLTIYSSTQGLFAARRETAQALGLPLDKVKVVIPHVGGGFGAKGGGLLEPLCGALALVAKRPVLLSLSRMEDLTAANPMPGAIIEIKLGAKNDGTLTALEARLLFDTGAYPGGSPAQLAGFKLTVAYPIPHYEIESLEIMTNRVGGGAYRAPGGPQSTLAIEAQIDNLAHRLGIDPLEIRRRNLQGQNQKISEELQRSVNEVLQRVEKSALWQKRASKGQYEGVGLAFTSWATCMGPASATCRLDDDGYYTVTTGVADISGVSTSLAQIAAETLQTGLGRIRMVNADSASAPHVGASGGSQITFNLGGAVKLAAQDTRQQLFQIAGEMLEANPADLELNEDLISVRGIPSKSVTLAQIASVTTSDYEGRYAPVLGCGKQVSPEWPLSYFAHLAHVKVDPETGEVQLLDYQVVQDVGFAINPAEVEGQIHGGVVQGLGWALYEQMVYDRHGTLTSGSLMDYALQNASMTPSIQTELVFVPSNDGPFGAKGVGEPPIVPGMAAVHNAVLDATGLNLLEFPATPERVLSARRLSAEN
jgi:CO/xanthine dehydrogenase Mo-binding subunit